MMKKYFFTLFFIAIFLLLVSTISIIIKNTLTFRIEIKNCEPIENPKNFYVFDEENKKLSINIITNCCSKLDIKKNENKYRIQEILKSEEECFCFCKRKIEIYETEKLEIDFINYKGENVALEEFCGISTFAYCEKDEDCIVGGCSREICKGIDENLASICIWKDCYENLRDYKCKCKNNRCQWV